MYQLKFQVGDWSGDGHGQHEDFILESSVSVEELREMYFTTKAKTKTSPENVCRDYGDNEITKQQIKDLGLQKMYDGDDFIHLFVDYMITHNHDLKLEIVQQNQIPTFHFYGHDKKKRHIGFMGYGLFES